MMTKKEKIVVAVVISIVLINLAVGAIIIAQIVGKL